MNGNFNSKGSPLLSHHRYSPTRALPKREKSLGNVTKYISSVLDSQ